MAAVSCDEIGQRRAPPPPPPPLFKLSPFAAQKGFEAIAGTLKSTRRLKDGSFLVECSRRQEVENLLSTTKFIDRKVQVSMHKALNSSRGMIRCREEICEELREQNRHGGLVVKASAS